MRLLRWAADHAIDDDPRAARLGAASLEALGASALLHPAVQDLIGAVFAEVMTRWRTV